MSHIIIPVNKVADYIKGVFDAEQMLHDIRVSGEVSGYGESGNNAFFVLKGGDAQLSCVCFSVDIRGFAPPKNGDKVVCLGSVQYYKKGGKLSFSVTDIRPIGQGEEQMKFLLLRDRLEREGLFDVLKKRPLPAFAETLGVVTSRDGAVIHDIKRIAREKNACVDIVLCDVRVQGLYAENDIAAGIARLSACAVDVIIVARGGGSQEDLKAFNTEAVVRAVAASPVPVVSAVGHETDTTLCDLAADARAATPTAAADMTVASAKSAAASVRALVKSALSSTRTLLAETEGTLRRSVFSAAAAVERITETAAAQVSAACSRHFYLCDALCAEREAALRAAASALDARSPLKVLAAGFAAVTDGAGKPVCAAASLKPGDKARLRFTDGVVHTRVE